MRKIEITIAGESPSSFLTSKTGSNVEESLDYLPGSSLRGGLAQAWIKTNGLNETFKNIFTSGKVHYCNLYKDGSKPIPLSAVSCKYASGFKEDMNQIDEVRHGVADILLSLIKADDDEFPLEYQKCVECKEPMKKYRGYYENRDYYKITNVSKRLIYHSSISGVTETSVDGGLYSNEVIEKGQVFKSVILIFDDAIKDEIYNFIKNQKTLFLGSDISRGLGHFRIISLSPPENNQNDISELKERINDFNKKLDLKDGKIYFSITLQSDAIIKDCFMRFKTIIQTDDIGVKDSNAVLCISENRIISGWNSLLKMPKEDSVAITKGSVFVFCIDDLDTEKLDILYQLENKGIGKRKEEGFGRLTVCDPFHYEGSEIK